MSLLSFITKLAKNFEITSYSEDAIKQTVVLPIFQFLCWDIFTLTEVTPEYTLESKRVDYALCDDTDPLVFVEVKRPSINLEDCQEQLLSYSFMLGVRLAVLTNGINWWFYLPLQDGHWEKRKYFSINIFDQNVNDTTQRLADFLSKDNVVSGKAEGNAKRILKGKYRSKSVQNALPKAWKAIISEPDGLLLEILKEKVEAICGFTPSVDELMQFVARIPDLSRVDSYKKQPNEYQRRGASHSVINPPKGRPQKHRSPNGIIGQDEMLQEILDALRKLGGRATKSRVEEMILKKYESEFQKEWYQESVAHGVPRWKHNIAWAKEKLKHDGAIKPPSESGRGIWELTDKAKSNM